VTDICNKYYRYSRNYLCNCVVPSIFNTEQIYLPIMFCLLLILTISLSSAQHNHISLDYAIIQCLYRRHSRLDNGLYQQNVVHVPVWLFPNKRDDLILSNSFCYARKNNLCFQSKTFFVIRCLIICKLQPIISTLT